MGALEGIVGSRLGRFAIEGELGEGGAGVVFVAYDPELDRRVAIKVLRPSGADAQATSQATIARSARLQREAQAMAKLSHPNVVTIFDVGVDRDRIFIAMELVDGTSLRHWQQAAERPWRETLAMYLQAGSGLLAGHSAGLIHLDFKPDNVLVSHDGKVRVADFGLARSAVHSNPGSAPGATVTSIAGTPRYMAPEQWLGRGTDDRTDQFSFCVALWEALYGRHPFDVTALPRVSDGTQTDTQLGGLPVETTPPKATWQLTLLRELRPPPRDTAVPPRVAAALAKGLAHDPAARHPALRDLLDELARAAQPRRARWPGAAAMLATIAVTVTALLWWRSDAAATASPCDRAAAAIDGAWGPVQALALTGSLAVTGRGEAGDVAHRVVDQLARYRAGWRTMRREACVASRIQGVQSSALMDLRMQCLDRRLGELDGLVRALTRPPTAIDRAITAARELTPIEVCADAAELLAVQPLPAGTPARQAVLATEARLDELDGLRRTGAYREALVQAAPLVETARLRGYAPTLARALELHGWLLRQTGAAERAEAVTREAIRVAAEGHAAAIEAAAWTNLLYVVGHLRSRTSDAAVLRPAAEAAVARTGSPRLRARLAVTICTGLREQGSSTEAEAVARAEVARAEAALGPDDLDVSAVRGALATAQWDLGRLDDALATNRLVLTERERVLGPAHPAVGAALTLIGGILNDRGRYHEAREALERAVRILEHALGPDHTEVAITLNNLAGSIAGEGDSEAARRIHIRVLAIREKAFGPSSEPVALTLNNLGQLLIEVGRGAEAEPLLRRSVTIRETAFGPNHPKVASSLTNLAWALDVTGRCAEAVPLYDRATVIDERTYGRDHARVASPLSGRGLCLIASSPTEAIVALERAARLVADGSDPGLLAMTRFGLARALHKLGRDPARARELATQARTYAVEHDDRKGVAEIEAWLRGR